MDNLKPCPKCRTQNPQHAKYCRMCGKELGTSKHNICEQIINRLMHLCKVIMFDVKERLQPSDKEENAFTPDAFSSIQLSPKSICKIRFRIIPWLITFVLSCIILYISSEYDILFILGDRLEYVCGYIIWDVITGLIFAIYLIIAISAYQWLRKNHGNILNITTMQITSRRMRLRVQWLELPKIQDWASLTTNQKRLGCVLFTQISLCLMMNIYC